VAYDKAALLEEVKRFWIQVSEHRIALERDFRFHGPMAELFKWVSLSSAIVTAITAVVKAELLTSVSAVFTAAVTTAKEIFAPAERKEKLLEAKNNLESIQRDLSTFAWDVRTADQMSDAKNSLNNFSRKIETATKILHSIPTAEDKEKASEEFLQTSIYIYLTQCASSGVVSFDASDGDESPEGVPDDAPGLIQVSPAQR
jgi:hypothetical protein